MTSGSPSKLVVGASRGIGLALCKELLEDPKTESLIATHRTSSDLAGLNDLHEIHGNRLTSVPLDFLNQHSLDDFERFLTQADLDIDLAIHAAGILHGDGIHPEKTIRQCNAEGLGTLFAVNAIGPLMVAKTIMVTQPAHRAFKFAALSAMVGSIGDNRLGGWYGYRASKTALNQFMHTLAIECRRTHPQATVLTVHPGTTNTDLSRPFQSNVKPGKLYSPIQTAKRILRVVNDAEPEDSGQFLNWDGHSIPW